MILRQVTKQYETVFRLCFNICKNNNVINYIDYVEDNGNNSIPIFNDIELHKIVDELFDDNRDVYLKVIELFAKLINSTVTDMIIKNSIRNKFRCIKNYNYLCKILGKYVDRYNLRNVLDKIIKNMEYKSLGELLSLIPVSTLTWQDVKDDILEESFTRNSVLIIAKYNQLDIANRLKINRNSNRINKSYKCSKEVNKLLMYHKCLQSGENNMIKVLQEIDKIANYDKFMKYVEYDIPSKLDIHNYLISKIVEMYMRDYDKNYFTN